MSLRRRRVLALAALVFLVLILAWEHSGQGTHEMGDEMATAVSTCLAVLDSMVLGLLALGLARLRRTIPRPPAVLRLPRTGPIPRTEPLPPPARAGPALLQTFRC